MRSYYLLLAGLLCCFLSCQKEPDANLLTPTSCSLDHIYYYDANVPIDTVDYDYTGNKVAQVNYSQYHTKLEYTGTQVTKRNYFVPGAPAPVAYDVFTLNADSTISKVEFFLVDPASPQPFLFFRYNFTYTGGKLTTLITNADTSDTGTGPVPILEYHYAHTGNNISRAIEKDLINGTSDTLNYAFDAGQNYFSKNPTLWLSDNLFADFNGFLLPFALSVNNVTSLGDNSGGSSVVTYVATDKDQISELRVDGDLWTKYFYKCQ